MGPAEKHLAKADKHMAKYVSKQEAFPASFKSASKDPYRALIRAVVFQQLSGKAATTIYNRVMALFPDKAHPDPHDLIKAKDETLRGAGLSRQKIAALRDISQKRLEGIIPISRALNRLPDEEIIARLTGARGVGRWTVEMLLMFDLGRPDVLPVDDLGIQQAMQKLYGIRAKGRKLHAHMAKLAEPWRPYRSYACMLLWQWKSATC